MSFTLIGILNSQAAGAAQAYFLAAIGGTGEDERPNIANDADGNTYICARTSSEGQGDDDILIAKYDSNGAIVAQKTFGGVDRDQGFGIKVDSAGNIFILGLTRSDGPSSFGNQLVAGFNSSFGIQFQKALGGSAGINAKDLDVDSNNNLYTIGSREPNFNTELFVAKYNSAGTIQWQKSLTGSSPELGEAIVVDSSDNIYVAGSTKTSGQGGRDVLVARFDSFGNVIWQRALGDAGQDQATGIAVDSNNNVYVAAMNRNQSTNVDDLLLLKYNSAGSLQWQRLLGDSNFKVSTGIAVDSQNNVYIIGFVDDVNDFIVVAKYDESGNLQFQRKFSHPNGFDRSFSHNLTVDSGDNIIVSSTSNNFFGTGDDIFIAKIPSDGSLTGTYSLNGIDVTYEASSLSPSTPTYTGITTSLSVVTQSFTQVSSSLTLTTSTLQSATTEI